MARKMKQEFMTAAILVLAFLTSMAAGTTAKAGVITTRGLHLSYAPYILFPSNQTYSSNDLMLNVSFYALIGGNINFSMTYSLDGNSHEALNLVEHYYSMFQQPGSRSYLDGSVALPKLSEGSHNVTVYLVVDYVYWDSSGEHPLTFYDIQTVHFTIGDEPSTPPPTAPSSPLSSPTTTLWPSLLVQRSSPSSATSSSSPYPTATIPEFPMGIAPLAAILVIISAFACVLKRFKAED